MYDVKLKIYKEKAYASTLCYAYTINSRHNHRGWCNEKIDEFDIIIFLFTFMLPIPIIWCFFPAFHPFALLKEMYNVCIEYQVWAGGETKSEKTHFDKWLNVLHISSIHSFILDDGFSRWWCRWLAMRKALWNRKEWMYVGYNYI